MNLTDLPKNIKMDRTVPRRIREEVGKLTLYQHPTLQHLASRAASELEAIHALVEEAYDLKEDLAQHTPPKKEDSEEEFKRQTKITICTDNSFHLHTFTDHEEVTFVNPQKICIEYLS